MSVLASNMFMNIFQRRRSCFVVDTADISMLEFDSKELKTNFHAFYALSR